MIKKGSKLFKSPRAGKAVHDPWKAKTGFSQG